MSPLQKPDLLTEQMSGRGTQICLDQYQLLLCGGCPCRHRYSRGFAASLCAEGAWCCRPLVEKVALEIIMLGVSRQISTTEQYPCFGIPMVAPHNTSSHKALSFIWSILPFPSASPETILVSRGARVDRA